MRENKYDSPVFFEKYSRTSRSTPGLERAGESCPGKNQQQEYLDGRHHGFRRVPMFPE